MTTPCVRLPLCAASRPAEHYNENAGLGRAISDAVELAGEIAIWPQGLAALVAPHPKRVNKFAWVALRYSHGEALQQAACDAEREQRDAAELAELAEQLLRPGSMRPGSSGDVPTTSTATTSTGTTPTSTTPMGGGAAVGAVHGVTIDDLMRWRGPLILKRGRWHETSKDKVRASRACRYATVTQ